MPWTAHRDENRCSASKPWAVTNDDTDELMGCHETESAANDQVTALYANSEDAGKGDRVQEHKSFEISEFKALADKDEPGSFEALVAVFDNVDYGGDRIVKGAFQRSLGEWAVKGRSIPVLWSHDAETPPIGVVTKAQEIGAGLKVKAKLLIDDNPQAKAIHAAMKAGALAEFSFGYAVKASEDAMENGQPIRILKDLDLGEVSPVFRGMNPATQLRSVKSYEGDAKARIEMVIQTLTELSEQHADVQMKAVADSLQDVLDKFEAKQDNAGEHEDNPEPNAQEAEEAKARIGRLLLEKPIHQEATRSESE